MTVTKNDKVKILLIDDHPILRKGLTLIINQEENFLVSGEAEDRISAFHIINHNSPDIALVDISLKGCNGLELVKDIHTCRPELPMLVLSRHPESVYAERALRAGARGYIMKQEPPETLLNAIRLVLRGEIYVSDFISQSIVKKKLNKETEQHTPLDILSDRELEVFQLIGTGYQPRQIANQMNLSVKTVETYRTNIKQKLQLKDASELIQYAIQWNQQSSDDSSW